LCKRRWKSHSKKSSPLKFPLRPSGARKLTKNIRDRKTKRKEAPKKCLRRSERGIGRTGKIWDTRKNKKQKAHTVVRGQCSHFLRKKLDRIGTRGSLKSGLERKRKETTLPGGPGIFNLMRGAEMLWVGGRAQKRRG